MDSKFHCTKDNPWPGPGTLIRGGKPYQVVHHVPENGSISTRIENLISYEGNRIKVEVILQQCQCGNDIVVSSKVL